MSGKRVNVSEIKVDPRCFYIFGDFRGKFFSAFGDVPEDFDECYKTKTPKGKTVFLMDLPDDESSLAFIREQSNFIFLSDLVRKQAQKKLNLAKATDNALPENDNGNKSFYYGLAGQVVYIDGIDVVQVPKNIPDEGYPYESFDGSMKVFMSTPSDEGAMRSLRYHCANETSPYHLFDEELLEGFAVVIDDKNGVIVVPERSVSKSRVLHEDAALSESAMAQPVTLKETVFDQFQYIRQELETLCAYTQRAIQGKGQKVFEKLRARASAKEQDNIGVLGGERKSFLNEYHIVADFSGSRPLHDRKGNGFSTKFCPYEAGSIQAASLQYHFYKSVSELPENHEELNVVHLEAELIRDKKITFGHDDEDHGIKVHSKRKLFIL